MRRKASKMIIAALVVASLATGSLGDVKIKRRVTTKDRTYETTTYLKGARQREEYGKFARVIQCDLKQIVTIDLQNSRYGVYSGANPMAAVMAFNEFQGPTVEDPVFRAKARSKGVLTETRTVIDTGERREMFGFTARHLKTITIWEANPKRCDGPEIKLEKDGWYINLLYGIDCSPDLSGSVLRDNWFPSGRCFAEYVFKRGYWSERQRSGPWPLGFPLLETTTTYDNKGKALVMTDEVLELSTAQLDAALFDAPVAFTVVETKPHRKSLLERVFSFIR